MGSTRFPVWKQINISSLQKIKTNFVNSRAWKSARKRSNLFLIPVFLFLVIGLWYLLIKIKDYPPYLLPPPETVWKKLFEVIEDGSLLYNVTFTLQAAAVGFAAAFVFASVVGYILGKSTILEKLVSPYLVAAQTVPLIAIAPLLVVWLGFGIASKIFIAFVIVFFPMLVNVIVGIRLVNEDQRELMRSYSASWWQVFTKLELPSALPVLFGGLKIGVTMAITGALVGEYVGSHRGLGFMIIHAKERFLTSEVFVTIFALMFVNVLLYGFATLLETIMLSGRKREESI